MARGFGLPDVGDVRHHHSADNRPSATSNLLAMVTLTTP